MIQILHLCPKQLSLNGETGNLDVIRHRLEWAGFDSELYVFEGGELPKIDFDLVFIGSGAVAGSLTALELLRPIRLQLIEIAQNGASFFSVGLGWEILGHSITDLQGKLTEGLGIYPSQSKKTETRASEECFGYFEGELTTGYANHGSDIELLGDAQPLILLEKGFGNFSSVPAPTHSGEGVRTANLWATRLNGPVLAINPHIADALLVELCSRKALTYFQDAAEGSKADDYARSAREELKARLVR